MKQTIITPQFVEFIPNQLQEGVLYISEKYSTAIHKCCCGCGKEVVTPLTPVDWKLNKEGNNVTLYPSIGNWNYPCQSHYWIRKNRVEWAMAMSKQHIIRIQERDKRDKELYVIQTNASKIENQSSADNLGSETKNKFWLYSLLITLKEWWYR
jgi:hypothetical protein